ncbi:MAG: hypothetical protein ABGU93_14400 [Acetobacterium sp.]
MKDKKLVRLILLMIWFNDDQTGYYMTFLGHQGTVKSVKFWK